MLKQSMGFLSLALLGLFYGTPAQAQCPSNPNPYGNDKARNDLFFCVDDVVFSYSHFDTSQNHPSNTQRLFLPNEGRDNLPQRMRFSFFHRDPKFFPFSCAYAGYPSGLSLTVHLPKVGEQGGYGIYKINDHIGVRLSVGDTNMSDDASKVNLTQGVRTDLRFPGGALWYNTCDSLGARIKVDMMLLKAFPAGQTLPPPAGRIKIATVHYRKRLNHDDPRSIGHNVAATGDLDSDIYLDLTNFTIRSDLKTCSLDPASRNITLNFPHVGLSSFKNQGDLVYGATTRIQLDCSQAGSNVTPYVVLHDVQNPNNRSDVLTIEQGNGKAKGVGIKLFKDNDSTALRYGPANIAKRPENQFATPENWWKFANKGVEYPSIQLTGYYARTGKVEPGDVRAQATITFSYQ